MHLILPIMPSIWKILIFACLCLGVIPSWANDDLELEVSERVVIDPDLKENSSDDLESLPQKIGVEPIKESFELEKPEEIVTERVKEEELLIGQSQPLFVSQPLSPQENIIPDKKKSPQVLDSLQSTDSQILDSLGIRKLAKGINIFRYTTYYLKHQSPIAKTRMPPENSVQ